MLAPAAQAAEPAATPPAKPEAAPAKENPKKAEPPLSAEEQAAMQEVRDVMEKDLANVKKPFASLQDAQNQLAPILQKLQDIADKNKGNRAGPSALFAISYLQANLGQMQAAIRTLNTLLERHPNTPVTPDAIFLRAQLKNRAGDPASARDDLLNLLKQYPDYAGKKKVEQVLSQIRIVGEPAVDFTTTDLNGKQVKLSDFRGKVVLLDFFAGWCPPCRAELPNLLSLYAKYHGRGFDILGISLDQDLDAANAYVKKAGIPWTVAWEKDQPVASLYGIAAIPAAFLIDKDGKYISLDGRGPALAQQLQRLFPAPDAPAPRAEPAPPQPK